MNDNRAKAPTDAAHKFAWVEAQIRQAILGRATSISCPYCSSNVVLGEEKLCCDQMGEATTALLQRMEAEEFRDTNDPAASSPAQRRHVWYSER